MKHFLPILLLTMTACTRPEASGIKAIVGAKLIAAPGRASVDFSVIVIDGANITAAGPQSSTPVPKGSQITSGLGMTVEPLPGNSIEPGHPADLILKGKSDKKMLHGEWQP